MTLQKTMVFWLSYEGVEKGSLWQNITAEMILLMKIVIKLKIIFLWSCINAKASLTKHSCRLQLNWLEWVFFKFVCTSKCISHKFS